MPAASVPTQSTGREVVAGPALPADAPKDDDSLIRTLFGHGAKEGLSPKERRLIRHSNHRVADTHGREHTVTSWKMDEFAYKRSPCPMPTRARGLFTEEVDGRHRIVARGYDKFFNVGEVAWTRVRGLAPGAD